MNRPARYRHWSAAASMAAAALIFLVDRKVPLGVAIGVLYVVPVLIAVSSRQRGLLLVTACVSTALILLGFAKAPVGIPVDWKVLANRALSLFAVWVTTLVSLRRAQAERRLVSSEQGLAAAQRIAHLGNWDWNLKTNELHWSDECYRIFGMHRARFGASYESFLSNVHPDDRNMVGKAVRDALFGGRTYDIRHRIVRPDGTERVVRELAEVSFGRDDKPLRMVGTVQDITESWSNERALQESEERFRQLAENINDVFWVEEFDTMRVVYVSPAVESIWLRPPEDFLGSATTWLNTIHPDDRERVGEIAAARHPDGYEVEYRILRPDGTQRWINDRSFCVRDGDGVVYRRAGVAKDITDRKLAEERARRDHDELERRVSERTADLSAANERLQEEIAERKRLGEALRLSENKYRALMTGAGDAILLTNTVGRLLEFNERAEQLLGYDKSELLGMSLVDLVTNAERPRAAATLAEVVGAGAGLFSDLTLLTRRGNALAVEITARRIDFAGGRVVQAIVRDVTERRREEARRLAETEAQRDALVREVHHRIKNNLQGVVGLLRQHAADHAELQPALQEAIAQVQSIAIVHGLHSQGLQAEIMLCDMVRAIAGAVQGLTQVPVGTSFSLDVRHPIQIAKSEAVPIALIINELMLNATKHADRHCAECISARLEGDCGAACIRLHNAGALPPDFDFATGAGLGTGLSLVRSLLPHSGASLKFRCDDAGTVIVELLLHPPVICPYDARDVERASSAAMPGSSMGAMRPPGAA